MPPARCDDDVVSRQSSVISYQVEFPELFLTADD
jgi:hypothetical protein